MYTYITLPIIILYSSQWGNLCWLLFVG